MSTREAHVPRPCMPEDPRLCIHSPSSPLYGSLRVYRAAISSGPSLFLRQYYIKNLKVRRFNLPLLGDISLYFRYTPLVSLPIPTPFF